MVCNVMNANMTIAVPAHAYNSKSNYARQHASMDVLTRLTDTPAPAKEFLIVSVPRLSVVAKERKARRKSTNTILRAMRIV